MPARKLPPAPAALTADTLLTTGQLAKLLPGVSEANHAHLSTVRRWCTKGIGVAGKRVRLRQVRTPGGQRLIRWGDFQEFRRECDRLRGEPEGLPCPTPSELKRDAAAARRELETLYREAGL